MLPDSATSPLYTAEGKTYLRSGFLLTNERAAYPELFDRYTPTFYGWTAMTVDYQYKNPTWRAAAVGNGRIVAVGSEQDGAGACTTSDDGAAWVKRTMPVGQWHGVTFANGQFVAVGMLINTQTVVFATSPDGITWTNRPVSITATLISITYGNGLFVAVGSSSSTGYCYTSPDGITWTARSFPATSLNASGNSYGYVTAAAFGAGIFVAVEGGGSGRIFTSTNGTAWSAKTVPLTNLRAIVYAAGQFVAAGDGSLVSADGLNWSAASIPGSTKYGLAYGGGHYMAVGVGTVATSQDGIVWTARNSSGVTSGALVFLTDRFVGCGGGYYRSFCHINQIGFALAYAEGSSVQYMRVK